MKVDKGRELVIMDKTDYKCQIFETYDFDIDYEESFTIVNKKK